MATKTEGQHPGEFLLADMPLVSRENVTVTAAAATKLQPGTVLGKLTATGKYVPYDNAGADGSEAAAGVLYGEVDNSAGAAPADFDAVAVVRIAAVRKDDLKWDAAVDAAGKTAAYADLASAYVLARD